MGRPSKTIKRDHQLNLSLTKDEYIAAYYRAESAGMRLVDYGRWRLTSGQTPAVQPEKALSTSDRLLAGELKRLGNNLNQLVRFCHSSGHRPPAHLDSLLLQLRALINRGAER